MRVVWCIPPIGHGSKYSRCYDNYRCPCSIMSREGASSQYCDIRYTTSAVDPEQYILLYVYLQHAGQPLSFIIIIIIILFFMKIPNRVKNQNSTLTFSLHLLHSHHKWKGINFMWKMTFEIFIKSLGFETPWVRKMVFYESRDKVKTSALTRHIWQKM